MVDPIVDGERMSLIGFEQLSARPDDMVILFQDEDTASLATHVAVGGEINGRSGKRGPGGAAPEEPF